MNRPARLVALVVLALTLPPATAGASSIAYVSNHNIWLASPDGTRQKQVTTDGTPARRYNWPSQADDGTILAKLGDHFVRLRPDGTKLGAPVPAVGSDVQHSGNLTVMAGPSAPRISPDGTRFAYWLSARSLVTCPIWDPHCSFHDTDYTLVSRVDRFTPPEEFGAVRDYRDPSWVGNDRLLVMQLRPRRQGGRDLPGRRRRGRPAAVVRPARQPSLHRPGHAQPPRRQARHPGRNRRVRARPGAALPLRRLVRIPDATRAEVLRRHRRPTKRQVPDPELVARWHRTRRGRERRHPHLRQHPRPARARRELRPDHRADPRPRQRARLGPRRRARHRTAPTPPTPSSPTGRPISHLTVERRQAGRAVRIRLRVQTADAIIRARLFQRNRLRGSATEHAARTGRLSLTVPLNRRGRAALIHHRRLRLTVRVIATAPGTSPVMASRKVTLRR